MVGGGSHLVSPLSGHRRGEAILHFLFIPLFQHSIG